MAYCSEVLRALLAAYGVEGKEHAEDRSAGAFFLAAAEAQRTLMPGNNLAADPKPQASSTDALGCIKGLEHSTHCRRKYAAARIRNGDHESGFSCRPICADAIAEQETATTQWLHGIHRIADQIAEDLPDLSFKTSHRISPTMWPLPCIRRFGSLVLFG